MARIHEDGFETGDTSNWDAESTTLGTLEVVSKAYSGAKGLKCATQLTNQAARARVEKSIGGTVTEIYARAYFWIDETLPLIAGDDRFYLIRVETTAGKFFNATIYCSDEDGKTRWAVFGHSPFDHRQDGSEVTQKSQWVCVELHVLIGTGTDKAEIFVDGNLEATKTGDASDFGYINNVSFGITGKASSTSDPPSDTEYPITLYLDECVIDREYIGTEEPEAPPPPSLAEQISSMMSVMINVMMVVMVIRMMSGMLKGLKK